MSRLISKRKEGTYKVTYKNHRSLPICNTLQYVTNECTNFIWATTWHSQQNGCADSEDSDLRPGRSEFSLSACRSFGSLATRWAHSEDSDQTGRMSRLIWVFVGRTLILLVLWCRGSYTSPNSCNATSNIFLNNSKSKRWRTIPFQLWCHF